MLAELEDILKEWAAETTGVMSREDTGCHIVTFGSYKLGVVQTDSDIDSLCLAPSSVSREDFFTSFAERLQARTVQ